MRRLLRQALVERVVAAACRSFWDAHDVMGQKFLVIVPAALFAAFVPIIALGLKWDRNALGAIIAALLAYPTIFSLAFLDRFAANLRHPGENAEWLLEPPNLYRPPADPSSVRFSIKSKIGAPYLASHACRVRHPNGETYEAVDETPGNGFRFFFDYPTQFAGAAPFVPGCYLIIWLLPRGPREKLREVLRHQTEIVV
jgi:hypothetical protein